DFARHGRDHSDEKSLLKLSLIIPVYNESHTLPAVWEALHRVKWPLDVEYILVDDGSKDGSRELISSLAGPGVETILQPENRGKTAAIVAGIEAAEGDIIAVQDADLEYEPNDLVRIVEPIIEDRADVVYGSRFKQSGDQIQRTYHRLGVKALTYFS